MEKGGGTGARSQVANTVGSIARWPGFRAPICYLVSPQPWAGDAQCVICVREESQTLLHRRLSGADACVHQNEAWHVGRAYRRGCYARGAPEQSFVRSAGSAAQW